MERIFFISIAENKQQQQQKIICINNATEFSIRWPQRETAQIILIYAKQPKIIEFARLGSWIGLCLAEEFCNLCISRAPEASFFGKMAYPGYGVSIVLPYVESF